MKCPGCQSPIGDGPFPVVGVLRAYDLDKEGVEKEGNLNMRLVSEFLALAMVTCPSCHWVFFLPVENAKSQGLALQYSEFKE